MDQTSPKPAPAPNHKKTPAKAPEVPQIETLTNAAPLLTEIANPTLSLQRARQPRAADVLMLQRVAGNRAINRLFATQAVQRCGDCGTEETLQTKRLAQPITGTLQRHEDAHQSGCGCATCQSEVQRSTTDDVQMQRSEAAHAHGCSCGACASIQRSEATHGRGCNCVACASIQRRPADYFLQRYPVEGAATFKTTRTSAPRVQRHSSWEHKALGDIVPTDLAIIGAARNLKSANGQKSLTDEAYERDLTALDNDKEEASPTFKDNKYVVKSTERNGNVTRTPITREMILHVLEQEIRRLNYFKSLPQLAKGATSAGQVEKRLKDQEKQVQVNEAMEKAKKEGKDVAQAAIQAAQNSPEWDVRIIGLPLLGGVTEYITYGEMNTLADIYGSVDEITKTDPENLHGIVQGIRQQSLYRFMALYQEVSVNNQSVQEAQNGSPGVLSQIGTGTRNIGGGIIGGAGGAVVGGGVGAVKGLWEGAKAMGSTIGNTTADAYNWGKGESTGLWGGIKGVGAGIGGALWGLVKSPFAGTKALVGSTVGGMVSGGVTGATVVGGLNSERFDGAIGNTGKGGNMLGEFRLMGIVPGEEGKKQLPGDKTTDYSAGLARNACHFPPDSWNAWERYHTEAQKEAVTSHTRQTEAGHAASEVEAQKKQAEAEVARNKALMLNGFGDHFLQDSYAAGHLIDKTKIMKFYVQWVDKNGKWDYTRDKNWRGVQNIAYGQQDFGGGANRYTDRTARDPQMTENKGGTWETKHDNLGLKAAAATAAGTDEHELLKWWVQHVLDTPWYRRSSGRREKKVSELQSGINWPLRRLELALQKLFAQGVVYVGSYDTAQRGAKSVKVKLDETIALNEDYVPDTKEDKDAFKNNASTALTGLAKKANWKDYQKFMNNAFLQKSTNALHDYFCKKGLEVKTGDGAAFRIYGDDAMLQANSSLGVQHSNITAHMSREAVETAAATGQPKHSIDTIRQRFPAQVITDKGTVTLDQWHNDGILRDVCENKVFPDMNRAIQAVMGIKGGLGEIHKENPHGDGSVF